MHPNQNVKPSQAVKSMPILLFYLPFLTAVKILEFNSEVELNKNNYETIFLQFFIAHL